MIAHVLGGRRELVIADELGVPENDWLRPEELLDLFLMQQHLLAEFLW